MHVISVRNVNHSLVSGIKLLKEVGEPITVRGLATLEAPGPVATVYSHPNERVLFDPIRDANPFFHLMESLWILAGRDDVGWLSMFNSRIREFSDDGVKFHAPYGHRLRKHFGVDQLTEAIKLLSKDRNSRQAVLAMWAPSADLNKYSKDIPCNTNVYLKIREGKLNITVCCRSNDLIWGQSGANAVQFSVLQEYLAAGVGVEIGQYTHISDSYHVYNEREDWKRLSKQVKAPIDLYSDGSAWPLPMFSHFTKFDEDLKRFMEGPAKTGYWNTFFGQVALPLWKAWFAHKKSKEGLEHIHACLASDWRIACEDWLKRRERRD